MAFYQIDQFKRDLNQGTPVVEVLTKVYKSPYKNHIIQEVANRNYHEDVKFCVKNMDFILKNESQFSGMNWIQVAQKIQGSDVKGANVGFGDQENWEEKFKSLTKNYIELQRDYENVKYEREQLFMQVNELKLQVRTLEEERKQYLERNRDLAQQIGEYTTSTQNTIKHSVMQMSKGKGTIAQLEGQITTLEQENRNLRDKIKELEYLVKFEQNKGEKKPIGKTDAEIAMEKGFNDTINLINQLKGNNGPALGYTNIPLLSNGNTIPMSGSIPGSMPNPNVAIPMPPPPGMGSRPTGPIYSSQMNVNEIPRRSGAMVEEPYNLIMRGSDNQFSISFFINPDEQFIKIMNGLVLPIYGPLQNENYVNGEIYLNARNSRINLMNYLDDPGRYKQAFDQWYRNQLGNDYNPIGSLVNAYKYILYEIQKQGKQEDFLAIINQVIALA